jgi:hypothetical protein
MRILKLHLHHDIPYILIRDESVDFLNPYAALDMIDDRIRSFAGSPYRCSEASLFTNISSIKKSIDTDSSICGFSLIPDQHTQTKSVNLFPKFYESTLQKGNYLFTQLAGSKPEIILGSLSKIHAYFKQNNELSYSKKLIFRMVNETGGILANNRKDIVFQFCIPLDEE